jgi:large subunit ribosomal protein L30
MSTIKVKLVRSPIGHLRTHRRVLASLGLRKINQVKELPDCPEVRGQIRKVAYLLSVSE